MLKGIERDSIQTSKIKKKKRRKGKTHSMAERQGCVVDEPERSEQVDFLIPVLV